MRHLWFDVIETYSMASVVGISWMLLITPVLWRSSIVRPKSKTIRGYATRAALVVPSLGTGTLMIDLASDTCIMISLVDLLKRRSRPQRVSSIIRVVLVQVTVQEAYIWVLHATVVNLLRAILLRIFLTVAILNTGLEIVHDKGSLRLLHK